MKVYNPLNEDFIGYWDGIEYRIPAGEEREFEDFLAEHLAKHLARKILGAKLIIITEQGKEALYPDIKTMGKIETEKLKETLLKGRKETIEEIENKFNIKIYGITIATRG